MIDITTPEEPAYCFLRTRGAPRTAREYLSCYYNVNKIMAMNDCDNSTNDQGKYVLRAGP